MRINTPSYYMYRTSQQLAMKFVLLLLVAVVAATNAKFQFTEEWELWKKVPLFFFFFFFFFSSRPSTMWHYLCSVGSRKRIFIRRGRALASHHLGGQQELRWQPQWARTHLWLHRGHEPICRPGIKNNCRHDHVESIICHHCHLYCRNPVSLWGCTQATITAQNVSQLGNHLFPRSELRIYRRKSTGTRKAG